MTNPEIPNRHYRDLLEGEIRLVDLHPGLDSEPLKCSLRTVDSLSPPPYEGLSYTWEEDIRTERLECDGSVAYITPSLRKALTYLRNATDARTLWIDQICMNQDNDSEKSIQIPLMPWIFNKAARVLVWLGEEDTETDLVFHNIREVAVRARYLFREGKLLATPETISQEGLQYLQLGPNTAPEWVAYRNILKRTWFSRVWTYEEIVLSRDAQILCGHISISWREFISTYSILKFVNNSILGHQSYLIDDNGIMAFMFFGNQLTASEVLVPGSDSTSDNSQYKPSHDLLNLVKMLRGNKTKHARDKIYGVLGVAKDLDDSTPRVDVTVNFRTTYCEFTKWFIHRYNDLSVLKLVDISFEFDKKRENPGSLPSWIPDYRHYDFMNNMPVELGPNFLPHGSSRLYNATLASKAYTINEDTNQLSLKGILIGKIIEISQPAGNLTKDVAIGPRVLTDGEWFQLAAKYFSNGIYTPTDEPLAFAYARTRSGDHIPREQTISDRQERVIVMKERGNQTDELEPGPVSFNAAEDGLPHLDRADIGTSILRHTTRRRFYITDTGYMGICHRSCRAEDYIYLLMGGDMPFVLRKLSPDRFWFKGESYVHGVMDGELLAQKTKQMEESRQVLHGRKLGTEEDELIMLTEDIVLI